MKSPFEATPIHIEKQLEEMRHTLAVVHRSLSGTETCPTNLDELIRALLCAGVARQEIAFLIENALPLVA
ncbi:hypothetical protein EON80_14275 [bacterium]|nr:MAG: hypothetical protein EON80_14275 [bacterium]